MEVAFDNARKAYARAGQTDKAEAVLQELSVFRAYVIATAVHVVGVGRSATRRQIKFYSNHRIDSPTGDATWTRKGNKLILRWPTPTPREAPGWTSVSSTRRGCIEGRTRGGW